MCNFLKRYLPQKTFKASAETKDLGYRVHNAYLEGSYTNKIANKESIILVVEVFSELFKKITSDTHNGYYRGNLISTGRIEGNIKEILGTVEQAVTRTIDFINASEIVHASQCEFFSRNIDVILRDESFSEPPLDILSPYLDELNRIAAGNII